MNATASMVRLEDMLHARDRRQARQRELLSRWPGASVIVLTVVAPGSEKRNRNTSVVASAGADALCLRFASSTILWSICDYPTGFELWIVSSLPPYEAKCICVEIEESHPLGRLMDIDVIGEDCRPLSRNEIGLPERSCLICGDNARLCMRTARHSYSDLLKKITDLVDAYVSTF